jgi:HlyD family secretion protein
MKKKLKRIIAIFVTIPVLIIAFQVGRKLLANRESDVVRAAVPVVTEMPKVGSLENSILYSGTLVPEKMVTVLPKTSGKLERIYVEEGQVVAEGDLLGTVDKEVAKLQMEQARAAYQAAFAQYKVALRGVRPAELENARALLAQAEKDLVSAKTNLERSKRLLDAGTISQANYEETERLYQNAATEVSNVRRQVELMAEGSGREELEMAGANAEAAEAQYELAKLQYENTEIAAPVSGMVAKIMAEEGSMVGPGVPILLLVQDDPVYVEIPMPEKYYGKISEKTGGIEARVFPAAYPDSEPYFGEVTNVARVLDPESRTFSLEVSIDNPEQKLRPGMYVTVEIILDRSENTVMVPESSLVFRNDTQVVFIVDGDEKTQAKMKQVRVGLRRDGIAEISEGINSGDRIIIKGNAFLEEGQLIEPVDG